MNNQDRAKSARMVLSYFCELVPNDDDVETLAADLICNIKHLLDSEGIDYRHVLDVADSHFKAETQNQETQP